MIHNALKQYDKVEDIKDYIFPILKSDASKPDFHKSFRDDGDSCGPGQRQRYGSLFIFAAMLVLFRTTNYCPGDPLSAFRCNVPERPPFTPLKRPQHHLLTSQWEEWLFLFGTREAVASCAFFSSLVLRVTMIFLKYRRSRTRADMCFFWTSQRG